MTIEQKLTDLIEELKDSNNDQVEHSECESMWDVGFDDGFLTCSGLLLGKLENILQIRENPKDKNE